MEKKKKILAIVAIVFLVLLYLSALICAFFDTTASLTYLKISIAATFFFPVMFYVMTIIYKLNNKDSYHTTTLDETTTEDSDYEDQA